ncbi:MAG TPA: hypothetical protein VLG44_04050 [Chlamydiales bacterium]|nr:hypothetical protein [Chlamydiales bacterium]
MAGVALTKSAVSHKFLERPAVPKLSKIEEAGRPQTLGVMKEQALKTAELAKRELERPRRDLYDQVREAQAAANETCEGLSALSFEKIDIESLYIGVDLYLKTLTYESIAEEDVERKAHLAKAKIIFQSKLPAILQNDTQIKEWQKQVTVLAPAKKEVRWQQ